MDKQKELRELFAWCLGSVFEACDIDGADYQDEAVELGLLVKVTIPEDKKEFYPACYEYECDELYFPWDSPEAKGELLNG